MVTNILNRSETAFIRNSVDSHYYELLIWDYEVLLQLLKYLDKKYINLRLFGEGYVAHLILLFWIKSRLNKL